jgi:hypothetical protein
VQSRGDALDVTHATLGYELLHARHGGGRSLELGPAVHVHDAGRLAGEVDHPVERGVAAAEDHEPLTVEPGGVAHPVMDLLVLECIRTLDAEPARLERAESRRDHDGPGDEPGAGRCGEVESAVLAGTQLDDFLAEVKLGAEGLDLLHQPVDQLLGAAHGSAGMS